MRKTSQDGGDSSSITSGIENEIKKPGAAINKTKKNSIKRKITNFSNESDDAVIEPLLQKDKEKTESSKSLNQSAKYNILLSKTKTDANSQMGSDKDKLIPNDKSTSQDRSEPTLSFTKDNVSTKSSVTLPPIHNHMNTNVFNSLDGLKGFAIPRTQILIEIDETKQVGYNPTPLIFTTAKIHTDGKTKHMEPVQVTPVPILSTEVSVLKSAGTLNNNDKAGVSTNVTTMIVNSIKNNTNPSMDKETLKPSIITTNNITTLLNKSVDTKPQNSVTKTSIANTTISKEPIQSVVTKDTKKSEPIFTANNVNTVTIGYTPTEGKLITDNTKNRDNRQTKTTQQQPTNSAILGDKNVITPVGFKKSVATTPTQTATKDISKQINKDENDQVTMQKDKSGIMQKQIPNIDPNKNVKHVTAVAGSIKSEACDNMNLVTDYKNGSDSTTKDNGMKNMNGSLNNKQLQRQKVAIAPDTDESMLKVKLNTNLSSLSNDTKSGNNKNTTTANITTQIKSPVSENNSLREKPLSTPNSQTTAVTANPTPTNSTTSLISKLSTSDTTATKKTLAETAILQSNPSYTTVSSDPLKQKSLSINKSSINASVTKPEVSKAIAKPQITSDTNSASLSTTGSIKTAKATDAVVTNITSQTTAPAVSVANSVANKTTSQSSMGKSVESNAKSSAASVITAKPSTVKNNPTSMNSIITQAKSNATSTAANIGASTASIQKSSGSIKTTGGKSQDRDNKDGKSLKA